MYYITHYTVQLPYKQNEIKVKWMYASRSTVDEYAIVLKLTETYLNVKKNWQNNLEYHSQDYIIVQCVSQYNIHCHTSPFPNTCTALVMISPVCSWLARCHLNSCIKYDHQAEELNWKSHVLMSTEKTECSGSLSIILFLFHVT